MACSGTALALGLNNMTQVSKSEITNNKIKQVDKYRSETVVVT
jgi:hypothetical protein